MQLIPRPVWKGATAELFVLAPEHVTSAYVEWLNDPLVCRFLESRFARNTHDTTDRFVRDCIASPTTVLFGIRSLGHDGRHVGNIKIGQIDRNHLTGEVGIMIGDRAAWRHGIGTAAIDIASRIASEQLGLRKLTAGCYESNVASRAAFAKAGFLVEGERKRHLLFEGRRESLVLMGRMLE